MAPSSWTDESSFDSCRLPVVYQRDVDTDGVVDSRGLTCRDAEQRVVRTASVSPSARGGPAGFGNRVGALRAQVVREVDTRRDEGQQLLVPTS